MRAEEFARGADLGAVVQVLRRQRHTILADWLAAASRQTMHERHAGRSVADHIPSLFDALMDVLERAAPSWLDPGVPLEDPAVLDAAQRHARSRFEQGLSAAEVVTEFRLLRQEIGRALRIHLPADAPTGDVLAAELLVHDALDGATSLALTSLGRELEQLREDVLATTVHDVQQPVTGMKSRLQFAIRLLSRDEPDIGRTVEMLQQADREIERMSGLLAELGQASRIAVGRLEIHPEPCDMRDLVNDALDHLDPDTHARCRFAIPPDAITAGSWDRGLIERVLGNLLSNAAKYSDPGTPIEIELSNAEEEAIHLGIRDVGMGLTEHELGQLFQRYTRTQRASEAGAQGAGLGLYVSRGIVEAHGGRIWAESEGVGRGATFHIVLPRESGRTPRQEK